MKHCPYFYPSLHAFSWNTVQIFTLYNIFQEMSTLLTLVKKKTNFHSIKNYNWGRISPPQYFCGGLNCYHSAFVGTWTAATRSKGEYMSLPSCCLTNSLKITHKITKEINQVRINIGDTTESYYIYYSHPKLSHKQNVGKRSKLPNLDPIANLEPSIQKSLYSPEVGIRKKLQNYKIIYRKKKWRYPSSHHG